MKTGLQHEDLDHWVAAPLDPEELAVLEARGIKVKTGRLDPDYQLVRKRPAWLAFLLRLIRFRE